jgi:hypothetical protein
VTDLFGDPEPRPRRGQPGYLVWIAELTYPDGYRFWSLAAAARPKQLPAETTEMVWLIARDGKFRRAAVDVTDGAILSDHPQ